MNCLMNCGDIVHVSLFVAIFVAFTFAACASGILAKRIVEGSEPALVWWRLPASIACVPGCYFVVYAMTAAMLQDHGMQLFLGC